MKKGLIIFAGLLVLWVLIKNQLRGGMASLLKAEQDRKNTLPASGSIIASVVAPPPAVRVGKVPAYTSSLVKAKVPLFLKKYPSNIDARQLKKAFTNSVVKPKNMKGNFPFIPNSKKLFGLT